MTNTMRPVIDAVIANISAASVLSACAVGKDYSVMESAASAAAVVSYTGMRSSSDTFSTRERLITIRCELFVKDVTSPSAMMDYVSDISDMIVSSLEDDLTLQGTVEEVREVRATRTPGDVFSNGTVLYLPVNIEVDAVYSL